MDFYNFNDNNNNKFEQLKPLLGLGVMAVIFFIAFYFYSHKDKMFNFKNNRSPFLVNDNNVINNNDNEGIKNSNNDYNDDDKDGLNNLAERIYGTDPKNNDTDGDGYLDGKEVEKNYNPLGKGEIERRFKDLAEHYLSLVRDYSWGKDIKNFGEDTRAFNAYVAAVEAGCAQSQDPECFKLKAFFKKDISICNKISFASERWECIEKLAIFWEKEKYCKNLPSNQLIDDYSIRDECYYEIFKSKKDPAICRKIKSKKLRSNCFSDAALLKFNPKICDRIQGSGNHESVFGKEKVDCYENVAILRKDDKICAQIPPAAEGSIDVMARYECWKIVALTKNDLNSCLNLREDYIREEIKRGITWARENLVYFFEECVEGIVNNLDYKESDCQTISDKEAKEICLKEFAKKNKNINICTKLSNRTILEQCYSEVGRQGNDLKICQKLEDESLKNECLLGVAKNTRNRNICRYVSPLSDRNQCYGEVGIELKDELSCDLIDVEAEFKHMVQTAKEYNYSMSGVEKGELASASLKDICYNEVAKAKKDKSICYKITFVDYLKKECLEDLKKY